jgi:hypothetical protein
MKQSRVLLAAALMVALAVFFPPAYFVDLESYGFVFLPGAFEGRIDVDLLIAELFAIALACSINWIYLSHSRMTVATAMPRSSASERW